MATYKFDDLPKRALALCEIPTDSRFKTWAKWVNRVDPSKDNGFAFVGDFIKDGTIEVSIEQPRVILCAAVSGSRRYQTTTYGVCVLHPDGTLEATDIKTTDKKRGWALRIRDEVSVLLDAAQNTITYTPVTVPISQSADKALVALRDHLQLDDSDIVAAALNHYALHLGVIK